MPMSPSLILGSGFHRHVFGSAPGFARRALYDWQYLVSLVAARMQVAVPDQVMSPVQRWETLLLRAANEGYRDGAGHWRGPLSRQAHLIEKDARRLVVSVLKKASVGYPQSSRARIPSLDCWGSIVSLNFDMAWESGNSKLDRAQIDADGIFKKIGKRELRRLATRAYLPGIDGGSHRSIWFPNGSCLAPETIRMGLHDYGAAPKAIQVAFSGLKAWEREAGVTPMPPNKQLDFCSHALRYVSEGTSDLSVFLGDQPMPCTWVADFLYRPLVFAGVGMSDQESGLWWLLAQRARNLARTGAPANAFILVDVKHRSTFWRTRPFGLEPIFCSDWNEGWEKVVVKASEIR